MPCCMKSTTSLSVIMKGMPQNSFKIFLVLLCPFLRNRQASIFNMHGCTLQIFSMVSFLSKFHGQKLIFHISLLVGWAIKVCMHGLAGNSLFNSWKKKAWWSRTLYPDWCAHNITFGTPVGADDFWVVSSFSWKQSMQVSLWQSFGGLLPARIIVSL